MSRPDTSDNAVDRDLGPKVTAKSIENILTVSEELNPVHVEVTNESYFFSMRRRIGARKHLKIICRENKNLRLESYIYKLKRSEDDGSMVAKKSFLMTHSSKWSAYKHCDAQCRLRDANPSVGHEKLFTHFIVHVVSQAFDRLSSIERNAMVYSEILNCLGCNSIPSTVSAVALGRRPPGRIKMASAFGENVCNLPIFRYLYADHFNSVTFLIDARTPSQWKPDIFEPPLSERYGSDHNSVRSGFLPNIILATAQKKTIKKIATATKLEPIHGAKKKSAMLDQLEDSAADELIDVPDVKLDDEEDSDGGIADREGGEPMSSSRSAVSVQSDVQPSSGRSAELVMINSKSEKVVIKKKTKEGGVYGHFFNDVSPDIRTLMMQGYKENKKLIQREGTKKPLRKAGEEEDSFTPNTQFTQMRKKMEGADHRSAYDVGTRSETEMMEQYNIQNLLVERVAIRLQRIWRIRSFHRTARYVWRRQYAAITVQRALRGKFGRIYAALMKKLVPIAASRIQGQYRKHLARKAMAAWLKLIMKAVRIIGPIVRKFATNCIQMWYKKINSSAIIIQTLMRRYLGHLKYCRVRGHMFTAYIAIPAVIKIQKSIRGKIGRRLALEQLERVLLVKVDIPCAVIMQRVFRGTRGRIRARYMRFINRSCLTIQKYMRSYHKRRHRERRHLMALEKWAATNIQRIYRGVLDRERAQHRMRKRWYETIFIPAIIRIQAVMRKYIAIAAYEIKIVSSRASTFIKRWYKRMLVRALYHERQRKLREVYKASMAAQIQKMIRAHQARRLFHRMRITESSNRILAGKIILRAWVSFRDGRRFRKLFDEHLAKIQQSVVNKMVIAREQVISDKSEALADLEHSRKTVERVKVRLKEVDLFFTESEMRVQKIQRELDALTPEDIDRGWAEAFGTELDGLVNQMTMAREEKRLRVYQLEKAQLEYVRISIEHEELDMELDAINVRELENMERLRLGEIIQIERRLKEQKERKIRFEKCKWKIESNRRNIIQRVRDEKLKEQVRKQCYDLFS